MSTVKANDLTNVTGGIPTVKSQQLIPTAWVNFNGTGTVAIRDSEGVSSITDVNTGQYKVNFSTNMASANFCVLVTSRGVAASSRGVGTLNHDIANTVGLVGILTMNAANVAYTDSPEVNVLIMGGQA
jgi:hypothetical protein